MNGTIYFRCLKRISQVIWPLPKNEKPNSVFCLQIQLPSVQLNISALPEAVRSRKSPEHARWNSLFKREPLRQKSLFPNLKKYWFRTKRFMSTIITGYTICWKAMKLMLLSAKWPMKPPLMRWAVWLARIFSRWFTNLFPLPHKTRNLRL